MYIYVCIHIYIYTYTHTHTLILMYIYTHTHTHIHMCTSFTHLHTHTHTFVYDVYMHVCVSNRSAFLICENYTCDPRKSRQPKFNNWIHAHARFLPLFASTNACHTGHERGRKRGDRGGGPEKVIQTRSERQRHRNVTALFLSLSLSPIYTPKHISCTDTHDRLLFHTHAIHRNVH